LTEYWGGRTCEGRVTQVKLLGNTRIKMQINGQKNGENIRECEGQKRSQGAEKKKRESPKRQK